MRSLAILTLCLTLPFSNNGNHFVAVISVK